MIEKLVSGIRDSFHSWWTKKSLQNLMLGSGGWLAVLRQARLSRPEVRLGGALALFDIDRVCVGHGRIRQQKNRPASLCLEAGLSARQTVLTRHKVWLLGAFVDEQCCVHS